MSKYILQQKTKDGMKDLPLVATYDSDGNKIVDRFKSLEGLSLEDTSWADIATYSEQGLAPKYFKVGDEKTITLTTGEEITVVILGFGHDWFADRTVSSNNYIYDRVGITFGMKNLLATTYPMNSSSVNSDGTNLGGWESCELRTNTMATYLSYMPSDLQSAIKKVCKKTTEGSSSRTIITSTDSLFLFSEVEVFGTTCYSGEGEGEQYEYFKKFIPTNSSRTKKLSNGTGSERVWWSRSPPIASTKAFCYIIQGHPSWDNSYFLPGVCFGFCV